MQHACICSNFFSFTAIAARGGTHQQIVIINQCDGTTIKFGFYSVRYGFCQRHIEHALELLVEFFQIAKVVAVAKRQHRRQVGHGGKCVGEVAGYPLCGAVGTDQLGMCGFQLL